MKDCRCRKGRVKCKECQKQYKNKSNVNGKQTAIIENITREPQRVNGSDITNKRLRVIRKHETHQVDSIVTVSDGYYHSTDGPSPMQ